MLKGKTIMNKHLSPLAIFALVCVVLILSADNSVALSTVNLGTSGNFVILAKSGVSTTGTTAIVGNVGVSPAAATFITGFGLIMDSSNTFSTSSLITGKIYATDYTPPTPAVMTSAISDMEIAYTDAAGRTLPDHTELGAGNIGGMTLKPGLYKWGTDLTIPTDVTLSGGANDIWIFQIAGTLDIANGKHVILAGGAQAKNIFWQVGGQTTLGTTSVFNGNILSQTQIVLNTGATLNGRALAQTAVTLDANSLSLPVGVVVAPVIPPPSSSGSSSSEKNSFEIHASATTSSSNDNSLSVESLANAPEAAKNEREKESESNSIETKEELIARINLKTGLNMSLSEDTSLGAILRTYLSNGKYAYIRILPAQASAKAQERLQGKCEEMNCTIELKEVKVKGEARASYEVKIQKKAKLFGFIRINQHVSADIDAETGEVIAVHKPWWSFLAKEENSS